ncbi:GxxExxY protein [Polaribacter reichenbachii]|uniref:GxxExxY protein n=1 Tax=Polaribacter reichenbachii TaxID=996801 RepID=A0A1B8U5T7_9FLAO|nr:GxxExxY protein [Polaribacter reichenbachii]APZ47831.1 GxxExxY protein [Polaribacter reichenbachii]AUC18466.1 GxxExxY protein [Polaribacter reichenbachii]OBY67221.1 GxxExxY protein [Polaribacter reichenbachii]
MEISKQYLNELTYAFLGCCINVHKELGPRLLESVYHQCLIEELKYNEISFTSEIDVSVKYRGKKIDSKFRADLVIENCMVVELKSVKEFQPIFEAQLLTYMHLLKAPKGILVNFNCLNIFKQGQKTFVNDFFSELPDK